MKDQGQGDCGLLHCVAIRDAIRGMVRELGGDPNAGVRLEILYGLQSDLKALESVSYNLKKKFPGMRRNIRLMMMLETWSYTSVLTRKIMPQGKTRAGRGDEGEYED